MKTRLGLVLAGGLFFATSPVMALDALVEEAPAATGLETFQFLSAGQTIELPDSAQLVLGYPASCVHERIVGGRVEIGDRHSRVIGGEVERRELECSARTQLAADERQDSGVSTWRDTDDTRPIPVSNLAPVIFFPVAQSTINIQRQDLPERAMRLSGVGRVVDLAARGVRLEPGGVYTVTGTDGERAIEIDFEAEAAGGPALTRLVRF